jgi:hypothetical protein
MGILYDTITIKKVNKELLKNKNLKKNKNNLKKEITIHQ